MVHLLHVSRNCADIKTSLKLNLSCIPPLNDLRRITVTANQFRAFAVAKMNNGTSCGQPYATSGGPPNSCAYTPANFSIATQSAIETCCGGPPYAYYQINDPPDCFQACNIKNGSTANELEQNKNTRMSCLNAAGVVNVYCSTTPPKASSGDRVYRGSASWSTIVSVRVLVGTSLFAL